MIFSTNTHNSLDAGIDIRKSDGTSCTYTRSSHTYTNPTFTGQLIYDKVNTAKQAKAEHLIDIWEAETGLVFLDTFPQDNKLQSVGFNKKGATASKAKSSATAPAKLPAGTQATVASAGKKRPATGTPHQEVSEGEGETLPKKTKSAAGPSKSAKPGKAKVQADLSNWLPVPANNPPSTKSATGGVSRSITDIRRKCTACRLNGRACDFARPCGTCVRQGNAFGCTYD